MSNKKYQIEMKKIIKKIFLFLVFTLALSSSAFADLYLNSITGSIYLNTSNIARMQVTSGGNLVLLSIANAGCSSSPDNINI